jgi:hypothetical protein
MFGSLELAPSTDVDVPPTGLAYPKSCNRRPPSQRRWRDPAALDALLRAVVASVEPAVAFTSLAAACVPEFADECHVAIVDEAAAVLRIAYPPNANLADVAAGAANPDGTTVAVTRIDGAGYGEEPAYWATVTFRWHDSTVADDVDLVIARLLAERVADQVTRERLAAGVEQAASRATNLETALASNREIGQAIGVLMATHKLTSEQAFGLLRTVSQNSNRKLRDIADEVIHTGVLEPPPVRTAPRGPAPQMHLADRS